jgi:BirA family biotin operon repressor/biotin-[acetyl-CoA-carboxylase] ligase
MADAGVPWTRVAVVPSTGSTNADLLARAAELPAGPGEALVLAADEQTAGRGRLGRTWVSPPGASVSVSVLVAVPPAGAPWLPLLTGLAVAEGIGSATGTATMLKWPNDVLLGEPAPGKVSGVLVERTATAACLGLGINTAMTRDELPVPEASSLALHGVEVDPDALVAAVLARLEARLRALAAASGDAERAGLAQDYRDRCSTIGREVVVRMPAGQEPAGEAVGIDADGRLVVRTADGTRAVVDAGDVVHVR